MTQEVKIKGLKYIDFHIMYCAAEEEIVRKAVIYSGAKKNEALKDVSILQEFTFKMQKSHITTKRTVDAAQSPKKLYSFKLKVHTALVLAEALLNFPVQHYPYMKSRIYHLSEQITKQIP